MASRPIGIWRFAWLYRCDREGFVVGDEGNCSASSMSNWYYGGPGYTTVVWKDAFGFPYFRSVIESEDHHQAFAEYYRDALVLYYGSAKSAEWLPALLEFGVFLGYINNEESEKLFAIRDIAML